MSTRFGEFKQVKQVCRQLERCLPMSNYSGIPLVGKFTLENSSLTRITESKEYLQHNLKPPMYLWQKLLQQSPATLKTDPLSHSCLKAVAFLPSVQFHVSAGTPSSTIIDQDAPSTSYLVSSSIVQPPITHQGVAAGPNIEDTLFPQTKNDPFVNVFAFRTTSDSHHLGISFL
ncbi:hypothetical protein Tco_0167270 [Tanacetum coccineum]